jgi:hypothetical protein
MSTQEKDELLLTQLVLMFQTAALQQMGKLKNPMLDRVDRDLGQAQISIDMVDMLQRKMANNLSAEEQRMFKTILQELRLNYVDEVAKSEPPAAPPPPTAPPEATPTP